MEGKGRDESSIPFYNWRLVKNETVLKQGPNRGCMTRLEAEEMAQMAKEELDDQHISIVITQRSYYMKGRSDVTLMHMLYMWMLGRKILRVTWERRERLCGTKDLESMEWSEIVDKFIDVAESHITADDIYEMYSAFVEMAEEEPTCSQREIAKCLKEYLTVRAVDVKEYWYTEFKFRESLLSSFFDHCERL